MVLGDCDLPLQRSIGDSMGTRWPREASTRPATDTAECRGISTEVTNAYFQIKDKDRRGEKEGDIDGGKRLCRYESGSLCMEG